MEAESCAASPGTGDEFGRLSTQPEEGEADLVSDGSGQMIARPKGGTVSLTWEDLCVTVADEQHRCISILQGLTGCARPGEVLAIIGPSGCGKSTLLDALAGRLSRKTKRTGQILLNGRKEPLAYGTSVRKSIAWLGCVTQDDVLTWTLTVREAIYLSAQLQLPDSMPLLEKKQRADTTIKEMGLHDAIDTRIGGLGNRGLSNGQKRRLSIYLEISTRPKLLFLDEPRRGLMRRIVSLAEQNKMTVLASIHQPNSEVFELYKSLCLLSLGRTVYFGLSSEATQFFPLNGFPCPSLQNPSDHYLRTINTDFDEDIEQGFGGKQSTEGVIKLLVSSYVSSNTYRQIQ
ncbi:ABC transporter G family member 1-like [Rhodamnia argentea]|uniref:ABC transporter G family member 1-like n=1 Tax=Rhodamnia argentea TaxID=178133 RepID=A0ABM3GXE9_9MYRT|nr:ABC transporter G family member 1-like [Rhodamnia argentea]